MMTDVIRWEINVQLFSDLLISNNGIPGSIRRPEEKQFVEFHLSSKDLLYKDSFDLPRIAAGSFWFSLEHLFNMKYKRGIEYYLYGKPSNIVFTYASNYNILFIIFLENQILEKYKDDREITNFYMIGDNPPVDIKGANESDFVSFLVRTGVFAGDNNDEENPAKYVVKDAREAVEKILSIEGII
jgi:HAD superfamily hydrolase (TIGR01456 family)